MSAAPEPAANVEAIVDAARARWQAGEEPDLYEILRDHPTIAAELEARLRPLEDLYRPTWDSLSGHPPPSASPATDGPLFAGRYRLLGELGRGASAVVYRADDTQLHRTVAVKVLNPDRPAGAEFAERFRRDAAIAAQLDHPNIVPVYDAGAADGRPFLVIKLIDGPSLEERAKSADRLPTREAVGLVRAVADALHYAHGKGIVHRDVKPSNVLLAADGTPLLIDFGLARWSAAVASLTVSGCILGTPAYMSPEQATGRGHTAGPPTDVYSLGVVLYRLIAGRLPFDRSETMPALLARIVGEEPAPPRRLNPTVPRDLETICLKCLEKRPVDRFASAAALADDLGRWLNGEAVVAQPPTSGQRLWRWIERHPIATMAAAAVAATMLVAGAMVWSQREKRRDAEVNRIRAEAEAEAAENRHRLEKEKGAELKTWSLLHAARERIDRPEQGRRQDAQELLRQAARVSQGVPAGPARDALDLERRALFAESLSVLDLEIEAERKDLSNSFRAPWATALHPDGNRLVVGTLHGPVPWERGGALGMPENWPGDPPVVHLAYSPDGTALAYGPAEGGLQLWDATARVCRAVLAPAGSPRVLATAFDSAGEALWTVRADGRVECWSLTDHQRREGWAIDGDAALTAARFHGPGSALAVGGAGGLVRLYERGAARPRYTWYAGRLDIGALAWAPDGRRVAVGTSGGHVQVWELKPDQIERFLLERPQLGGEVRSVRFSPDGRWLLAGTQYGQTTMWDARSGQFVLTGSYTPGGVSPDGHLYAGGNTGGVAFGRFRWPTAVRPMRDYRTDVLQLVWSGDGRRLAILGYGYEARVWDAASGDPVRVLALPPGDQYASNAGLALSHDGRLLGYAGGGRSSKVVLYDVAADVQLGEWSLPPGYERVAYRDGRFLLVRQEYEANSTDPRRLVVREFGPGRDPRVGAKELRPVVPGETGSETSGVTEDGRYFWWVGPRWPEASLRAEVYDLASGRPVRRIERSGAMDLKTAHVPSGDDRLWVKDGNGWLAYRLADDSPPQRHTAELRAVAPSGTPVLRWKHAESDRVGNVFRDDPADRLGLAFPYLNHYAFSRDGRSLAGIDAAGRIVVVELAELRRELDAFERGPE